MGVRPLRTTIGPEVAASVCEVECLERPEDLIPWCGNPGGTTVVFDIEPDLRESPRYRAFRICRSHLEMLLAQCETED